MVQRSGQRSFQQPFLLSQYEMEATDLKAYSGGSPSNFGRPAWEADAEGVRLRELPEITESVSWSCFLILIPGIVSGISAASSSSSDESLAESLSDPDIDVESSPDEISEGWYSCLSGDEVRRFTLDDVSSTGGEILGGFLDGRIR
jgi:hypothetical protein